MIPHCVVKVKMFILLLAITFIITLVLLFEEILDEKRENCIIHNSLKELKKMRQLLVIKCDGLML